MWKRKEEKWQRRREMKDGMEAGVLVPILLSGLTERSPAEICPGTRLSANDQARSRSAGLARTPAWAVAN